MRIHRSCPTSCLVSGSSRRGAVFSSTVLGTASLGLLCASGLIGLACGSSPSHGGAPDLGSATAAPAAGNDSSATPGTSDGASPIGSPSSESVNPELPLDGSGSPS